MSQTGIFMKINQDKTILITGASQGIGRRLAVHFAPQCKELILMARNAENLAKTSKLIEEKGGSCNTFSVDLSELKSLQAFKDDLGTTSLDVLINNAADVTSKPFSDTSLEEIHRTIQTNVTGVLQLIHLLLPNLNPSATIVNISSLAGYKANPSQTVYSISKKAVNGISEALQSDLGPKGHSVLNVALGSVALTDKPDTGQSGITKTMNKIQWAIENNRHELFMDPKSKWLMRLYGAFPSLARLR
jgi:short-subunit dehydrogenase